MKHDCDVLRDKTRITHVKSLALSREFKYPFNTKEKNMRHQGDKVAEEV